MAQIEERSYAEAMPARAERRSGGRWPLWGAAAGVLGIVGTIVTDVRPEGKGDGDSLVTAADMEVLSRSGYHLGVVAGYLAVAALLVFAAAWRRSAERFLPESIAARVVANGLIASAGALIFIGGIRSAMHRAKRNRLKQIHAGKPWMHDHTWTSEGIEEDAGPSPLSYFIGAIMLAIFLTPFHWIALVKNVWPFYFAFIFDIAVLMIVVEGFVIMARRRKYGLSRLRFRRFPFFLGEQFDAAFSSERPIGEFRNVTFTLRCLREQKMGKHVGVFELYKDELKIEQPGIAGAQEFPITFNLPAEQRGTDIDAQPPYYWELEIIADTSGVDYKAQFLVPVYEKPAG